MWFDSLNYSLALDEVFSSACFAKNQENLIMMWRNIK